jgi:predicted NBD/HSP70 family sugar kinase
MNNSISLTQIERQVVDLLMRTDGLSRFDVSQKLGGNAGTIARAVTRLINKGNLIEEEERSVSVGRPRRPLGLNPAVGCFVGIDLEATNVRGVVIDFARRIQMRKRCPLRLGCRPSTAFKEILRIFQELTSNVQQGPLLGVGLGIPGPCAVETGTILSYSENHSWDGFAVKDGLSKKLDIPIFSEHNIITMVLGENWFQFHGRTDNLINVLVRAGVAASFIINGAIYRGDMGMAGNISHLKVWPRGKLCECGQRGCMRQYTSAKALLEMMKEAGLEDGNKKQTIQRLAERAVNGDHRATRIVRKAGQALGIAIGHMVNSMGIQQVVINSDLNNAGNAFLDPIKIEARNAVSEGDFNPRISFSALEGYAGALGAAVMAMQQVCGIWEEA